jgi:RNA polymerase sigma-70 factor (ECF subfamily)
VTDDRVSEALAIADHYADHGKFLWSLTYRMTGSAADAEDIVQDTFVRALEHPPARADQPLRPWLVKVAVNRARDVLRARRRRRYIGPWLPSPVPTDDERFIMRTSDRPDPGVDATPASYEPLAQSGQSLEGRYDLVESVSLAFLVALETLTPTQRAVLLLRDVFDYTVKETADALDLSESNVKTTHHRARTAMAAYDQTRRQPIGSLQQATRTALLRFLSCLEQHDVAGVEALLAEDVKTTTDGGGEFRSALQTIIGRDKVSRLYLGIAPGAAGAHVELRTINGLPAALVRLDTAPEHVARRFIVQVELNAEDRIAHVYLVLSSSKLTAIQF